MTENKPILPPAQADTSWERVQLSIRLRFNPIRNLTPELLASYLDNFRLGFFRLAALAWDAMERRDMRIQAVAPKRKKSVSRHGWEILTLEDTPDAQAQKKALEYFYNNLTATTALEPDESGGMALLLRQMMDAVGKRYAVHEIVWEPGPDGLTAKFVFCPLWWFEGTRGKLRYLAQETMIYGVDLEPNGWLVTVGDGIREACSVAYMFKHLPLRDWLAYSEKFGIPGILGKSPAQIGSPEWDTMVQAVRGLSADWAAVISAEGSIDLLETSGNGTGPHQPLVQMMDKEITTLWRGGDLGTSSAQNSIGASLQESETDILDQDDAQMCGETLTHQVSRFVLDWTFGKDAPQLAYLKIRTAEKTNIDADMKVDEFLLPLGLLGKKDVLARYNRSAPESDEDTLHGAAPQPVVTPQPPADPAEIANTADLEAAARHELVLSLQQDLAPVVEQLQAIMRITDPVVMENRLKAFLTKLDGLKQDILHDPAAAETLQRTLAAAFAKGLAKKPDAQS